MKRKDKRHWLRRDFCWHRSHRWGLPCWRYWVYDQYCQKHMRECYPGHWDYESHSSGSVR